MLALALAAALELGVANPLPDAAAIAPSLQSLDLEIDPALARWNGSLQAWLDVRRPARTIALGLRGPVVSRVEISTSRGPVELIHGERPAGTLLIETRAPLPRGRAAMSVAFADAFADSGDGLRRTGARAIGMARAGGVVFPAWPAGTPPSRWRLVVHVPAGYRVTSALPSGGITRQGAWRTWTFESRVPVPAAEVAFAVRPTGRAGARD